MKGVAEEANASRRTASPVSAGRLIEKREPRPVRAGGRGLSVGSSSAGGAPANASRQ